MENFQPEFHQCMFYEEYKRQVVQAIDIHAECRSEVYL